ncbi:MAG: hypothetical protein KAI66_11540, partial [Lentisphaeria bacterium]|nr:hypothetical protein [Lentisphaeria bacterium]
PRCTSEYERQELWQIPCLKTAQDEEILTGRTTTDEEHEEEIVKLPAFLSARTSFSSVLSVLSVVEKDSGVLSS